MFGGYPKPRGLFRLMLDTRHAVATIESVQAAGDGPSRRFAPAVWIANALMVVWGGYNSSPQRVSDTDLHVFNAGVSMSIFLWSLYP